MTKIERLRRCKPLLGLLAHYVELGREDRQLWQDRLSHWQGLTGRELSKLYGELIAYGWLEQNTGMTPILQPGRLAACYRITSAGIRALREAQQEGVLEEEVNDSLV